MFTVRITMKGTDDDEKRVFLWNDEAAPIGRNQSLPVETFELACEWASTAVDQIDVDQLISVEPVPMPITRDMVHQRWSDAIDTFGEDATFEVCDKLIAAGDNLPLRTVVSRLEHHPAFQLLHRGSEEDQRGQWLINEFAHGRYKDVPDGDIRAIQVKGQMMYLIRRLLSTLAVRHQDKFPEGQLTPISANAKRGAWVAVIHKLRSVYHPTGERVVKTRADNDARKAAKQETDRQQRSAMKSPKGSKPAVGGRK